MQALNALQQAEYAFQGEKPMPLRKILAAGGLTVVALAIGGLLPTYAQSQIALSGQVASAEEGPMEGVLVSAKKRGSTVTVTVVSEEGGNYSFPATKLEPGQYSLRSARSAMTWIAQSTWR
jgi:hypothetical protein